MVLFPLDEFPSMRQGSLNVLFRDDILSDNFCIGHATLLHQTARRDVIRARDRSPRSLCLRRFDPFVENRKVLVIDEQPVSAAACKLAGDTQLDEQTHTRGGRRE